MSHAAEVETLGAGELSYSLFVVISANCCQWKRSNTSHKKSNVNPAAEQPLITAALQKQAVIFLLNPEHFQHPY